MKPNHDPTGTFIGESFEVFPEKFEGETMEVPTKFWKSFPGLRSLLRKVLETFAAT